MQAVELESLNHARGVATTWHRVDYVRRNVTELPAMGVVNASVSEYKNIYLLQFNIVSCICYVYICNINMYIICVLYVVCLRTYEQ